MRLAELGPRALPQLIDALRLPSREERVLHVFEAMGPSLAAHSKQLGQSDAVRDALLERLGAVDSPHAQSVARVLCGMGAEEQLVELLGRMICGSDAFLHERAVELAPSGSIQALAVRTIVAHVQHGGQQWHIESVLRRCSAVTLRRLYDQFPAVHHLVLRAVASIPLATAADRESAAHLLLRSLQQREQASSVALQRLAANRRLDLVLPALEAATPAERWPLTWLGLARPRHTILLAAAYDLIAAGLDDARREVAVAAAIRLAQKIAPRDRRTRHFVTLVRAAGRPALLEAVASYRKGGRISPRPRADG
jgi:hypothetical protein